MAALTACLLAATRDGRRHVVAVRPLYGGTDHVLATGLLGTTVTWAAPDEVAAAIRPDTALVIVETPANPTLDLVDIAALAAAAGDVPLLVDNTFATPVLQQPARHGATLVLHSATKYLGGHGDVLAGVVACDEQWAARLRQVRAVTGAVLHPLGGYLLHRGLQTLPLRVRAQQAGARSSPPGSAATRPWTACTTRVDGDPAAPDRPADDRPRRLLAFEVRGGAAAAAAVADACRADHPRGLPRRRRHAHPAPGLADPPARRGRRRSRRRDCCGSRSAWRTPRTCAPTWRGR